MSEIFEMAKALTNISAQGVKSGIEMGRQESERRIKRLESLLTEALEVLEGYEDVKDGEEGPLPNDAMAMAMAIREELGL